MQTLEIIELVNLVMRFWHRFHFLHRYAKRLRHQDLIQNSYLIAELLYFVVGESLFALSCESDAVGEGVGSFRKPMTKKPIA